MNNNYYKKYIKYKLKYISLLKNINGGANVVNSPYNEMNGNSMKKKISEYVKDVNLLKEFNSYNPNSQETTKKKIQNILKDLIRFIYLHGFTKEVKVFFLNFFHDNFKKTEINLLIDRPAGFIITEEKSFNTILQKFEINDTFEEIIFNYGDKIFFDFKNKRFIKLNIYNDKIHIDNQEITKNNSILCFIMRFVFAQGDRIGNKLFYFIDTLFKYLKYIENISNTTYNHIIIIFDELFHPEIVHIIYSKNLTGIGIDFLDRKNNYTNIIDYLDYLDVSEFMYNNPTFNSRYILEYLFDSEYEPSKKNLKQYLRMITCDLKKAKYNDNKKCISMHIRMSDFCTGRNTCFDKVTEIVLSDTENSNIKNNQGASNDFPILSFEYYYNCLNEILKDKDYSDYRLIIYYYDSFIDNIVIKFYIKMFEIKFSKLEIITEHEYLDKTKNTNELSLLYTASQSEYIIISNSTFGFFMYYFGILFDEETNKETKKKIYYPQNCFYSDLSCKFLDLKFEYETDPSNYTFKKNIEGNLNLYPILAKHYVCYTYKLNKSESKEIKSNLDIVRILLVYLYIIKYDKKFTINDDNCNEHIFKYFNPYLTYKKNGNEITFDIDKDLIKNTEIKDLVNKQDDNEYFNTLIKLLEKLSFTIGNSIIVKIKYDINWFSDLLENDFDSLESPLKIFILPKKLG